MPAARPVLGYASRSEAVRALNTRGLTPAEIVVAFARDGHAISRHQVAALLCYKRRQGWRVKGGPDVRAIVELAAHRRGITPCELLSRIITVIAQDDMFDAVLDDINQIEDPTHG